MALRDKFNKKAKIENETGLGTNSKFGQVF